MTASLNRIRKILNQINSTNSSSLSDKQCMNQYMNESVTLTSYPSGDVSPSNFKIIQTAINSLNNGDILVQIECISIDAYLRTKMYPKSHLHKKIPLGGKMTSIAIAKVIESRNNNFKIGVYLSGTFPVEKYSIISTAALNKNMYEKIRTELVKDVKYYLTYLGIATVCSAYVGAYYVSKPLKSGDIAVVNAASGAVGSIVCQLYRNKGCKVIGITGGKDKKKYLLDTLGLYQCIDYKSENIDEKLKEYAPKGFDVAFDNVGGEQLDILLSNINDNGQIVICGAVSQYSGSMQKGYVYGPKNYMNLVTKNGEMAGFNIFKFMNKIPEIRQDLLRMVRNGTLVIREVNVYGLDNFCVAMDKLLKGDKNGKILLYP